MSSFGFGHTTFELKGCWDNKWSVLLVVNILSGQTVGNTGPLISEVTLFRKYVKAVSSHHQELC